MSAPIVINHDLCLNFNYKKIQCVRCQEACPNGCLGADLSVREDCNECGLCIAACPAEAVMGENYSLGPVASLADRDDASIPIACRRRNGQSPWPCLGFLDARLLLVLACGGTGSRRLLIDNRACSQCKPGVAEHLAQIASQAGSIIARDGEPAVLLGDYAGMIKPKEKPISRRDFFSQLLGATVQTVREVVAANAHGAERLPRGELVQAKFRPRCTGGAPVIQDVFMGLKVTDSCSACGLCSKLCPNKAVITTDKTTFMEIYHDPLKCTGCTVCTVHCPTGAIVLDKAGRLEQSLVAVVDFPRCESCGSVFQPIGNQRQCLECMLKNKPQVLL